MVAPDKISEQVLQVRAAMVGIPISKGCRLCLQRSVKTQGSCIRHHINTEQAPKGYGRYNENLIHCHRKRSPGVRLGLPSTFKAERDQILSSFVSAFFCWDPPRPRSHFSAVSYSIFYLA
ncbi:Trans-enoyl reductase ACTTS2 [Fusarium oxysporum f. sp. albedinis]|nr:Trans-enoyl reductase ACTTS2 [Fusarium oxysporum f. sp. albedinis]